MPYWYYEVVCYHQYRDHADVLSGATKHCSEPCSEFLCAVVDREPDFVCGKRGHCVKHCHVFTLLATFF
jgi:hypothetical protein